MITSYKRHLLFCSLVLSALREHPSVAERCLNPVLMLECNIDVIHNDISYSTCVTLLVEFVMRLVMYVGLVPWFNLYTAILTPPIISCC